MSGWAQDALAWANASGLISGAVLAQGFSGSFYWATASDSDPSGSSITLQSPDGRCTITAWENSSIVRCEEPGETACGQMEHLCTKRISYVQPM